MRNVRLAGLLLVGALGAIGQDYSDDNVAVLLTQANLAEFGKGNVVAYYPTAIISRDPLRHTKGHFIFDSGAQRYQKTQIPLAIKFERATKELVEATKEWKEITPEKFEYSLATDVLLPKLRSLLLEEKITLDAGFLLTEPFTGLRAIPKETPISRYLFKKDVETSYLLEIGDRNTIEELHKTLTAPAGAALAIYHRHFKVRGIKLDIYKLRPGQKPTNPKIATGVSLSRHRNTGMPAGRAIINYGADKPAWSMLTTAFTYAGEVAEFDFGAAAFLENVVAPLVAEEGKAPPLLDCVIGEDENQTSCKKDKAGHSVKGKLGQEGFVAFVVEQIDGNKEIPDQYRIELHAAK